jgi:hypothetical protein
MYSLSPHLDQQKMQGILLLGTCRAQVNSLHRHHNGNTPSQLKLLDRLVKSQEMNPMLSASLFQNLLPNCKT